MSRDSWLPQEDSETTQRFRSHSRRAGLAGLVLALATLVVLSFAFISKAHGAGGWGAIAWLTLLAAGPVLVFVAVMRLSTASFRRRVAAGKD